MRKLTGGRVKIFGLALLAVLSVPAFADGGQIILHRTSGQMEITIFAAPAPLTTGPADLSVLIEDARTRQPVPDAQPELALQPPRGAAILLRPGRPGARLMQSVSVDFIQAGPWTISVETSQAGARNRCSATFNVVPSRSRATIVWFAVLLPLIIVALFVLHQRHSS